MTNTPAQQMKTGEDISQFEILCEEYKADNKIRATHFAQSLKT